VPLCNTQLTCISISTSFISMLPKLTPAWSRVQEQSIWYMYGLYLLYGLSKFMSMNTAKQIPSSVDVIEIKVHSVAARGSFKCLSAGRGTGQEPHPPDQYQPLYAVFSTTHHLVSRNILWSLNWQPRLGSEHVQHDLEFRKLAPGLGSRVRYF
jgi:hypothetical protein